MRHTKSELMIEVAKKLKNFEGFDRKVKKLSYGINESFINILDEKSSKALNMEVGVYMSFSFDDLIFYSPNAKTYLIKKIISSLKKIIRIKKIRAKKILIVGLGNSKFACDSLGKMVTNKLIITKPFLESSLLGPSKLSEVYAINTGVYGTTGIESSDIIKSISSILKPDLIIAVDSLVTENEKYLGKSIQISDAKLIPGGGVNNNREEISEEKLGTKILAIGVPLVAKIIRKEETCSEVIVTSKNIEEQVNVLSRILAKSMNFAFNKITEKEYMDLVG